MVDIMLAFEMLKFLKNAYMYKSYVRTCTYMYKSCTYVMGNGVKKLKIS